MRLVKLLLSCLLFQVSLAQDLRNDVNGRLPHWAFGGFTRPAGVNPILMPDSTTRFRDPVTGRQVDWESNDTFNPGAVVHNGKVYLLYRAEDKSGIGIGFRTSRLGLAESVDGTQFSRRPQPVLYPAEDDQKGNEWPGGVEDPRVAVTRDGTYVVFYTQWNRNIPRLGVATSKDLINWKKHGPIFEEAYGGKFNKVPHKSASIVTRLEGDRQVVARIQGKYWMYWGELGVFAATSDNLVDWQPVLDEKGEPKALISPRKGFFDSDLTECGPPAIMTQHGILLLYNGKNNALYGDPRFTPNSYCAGQVLFDASDPLKPLARLDEPFFRPMEAFEKSGQYVQGTVFVEGLAYFKRKWFLYYGCADSKVGVAVYDPSQPALPDPLQDEGFQLLRQPATKRVEVRYNGQLLTAYRYDDSVRKPFLYPVNTLDGITVTRGYPLEPRPGDRTDHPHQVGMWLNYESVNGLDFWNNSTAIEPSRRSRYGTILHDSILESRVAGNEAWLTVTAHWVGQQNQALLQEKTRYHFRVRGNDFIVDRETTLTARKDSVTFRDVKDGLFAIRVARELEQPSQEPSEFVDAQGLVTKVPVMPLEGVTGNYLNSEGQIGDATWGKKARWVVLRGKMDGKPVSVGILDHRNNPGYPAYWHARGYGLFAVNPLGAAIFSNGKEKMNLVLPPGGSTQFRYRVIIRSGMELSAVQMEEQAAHFSP